MSGEWIPVGERMPEGDQDVLVSALGEVDVASYESHCGQFFHHDEDKWWTPTHWMPLPPAAPTDAE